MELVDKDIIIDISNIYKGRLIFDISKDNVYPAWLARKIFTIEFHETMHDVDKQQSQILAMLKEFPSIRKFVCHYDYSEKIRGMSRHHYHGYLYTSAFLPLFNKYGKKKGVSYMGKDLLIWMRSWRVDDTDKSRPEWDQYILKIQKQKLTF